MKGYRFSREDPEYNVHYYQTKQQAEAKALQMKRLYGYKPAVFKETDTWFNRPAEFSVVEPVGLKRIDRRRTR